MSGIYIPDMEMPKSCGDCKFSFIRPGDHLCESDMFCFLTNKDLCLYKNRESINNIKMGDCPLVEVPPHGRLGDLDALAEYIKNIYCKDCKRSRVMCKACEYGDMIDEIEDAPTILEASPSTDGFCNTEGCSNSKSDMSKAQNHICPYYKGLCSLDERIICYRYHHYEMCDKFIEVNKERE